MRLDAFRTPRHSFFLGIIKSDEITITRPMEFLIDTGAEKTTISGIYFNPNFDWSQLEEGEPVIGVGGFQKTYIIHNVRIYLYTMAKKWFLLDRFDKIPVLSKRYNPETGELIELPCILGTDIIGNDYNLNYLEKKTFLEG